MAEDTSLQSTLSTFTSSAELATQSLPEASSLLPRLDGISLLDAKNEIFLAYLQALALRNLNVIRSLKDGANVEDARELSDRLTAQLLELRVYLERGVRQLEQKIKYQVDKAVKAANDEERLASQRSKQLENANGGSKQVDEVDGESGDDSADDDSESESDGEEASYKPKGAAMMGSHQRPIRHEGKTKDASEGVYRPPRISATSMPTTEQREPKARKPERSRTLDEYVRTELSNAPLAEPSIGSTIAAGGRRSKDARQLAREQERRDYEETHLMRLPPESKKERATQKARERSGGFGGEEFSGLNASVDKIGDLTKRTKDSALERSRKRRAVEDGPRNDGTGIGSAFDVKKRRVMKRMKR
jgi:U3 small nucleolar ribonucleoprotein protein LCP5